jgi:hypothetical protein
MASGLRRRPQFDEVVGALAKAPTRVLKLPDRSATAISDSFAVQQLRQDFDEGNEQARKAAERQQDAEAIRQAAAATLVPLPDVQAVFQRPPLVPSPSPDQVESDRQQRAAQNLRVDAAMREAQDSGARAAAAERAAEGMRQDLRRTQDEHTEHLMAMRDAVQRQPQLHVHQVQHRHEVRVRREGEAGEVPLQMYPQRSIFDPDPRGGVHDLLAYGGGRRALVRGLAYVRQRLAPHIRAALGRVGAAGMAQPSLLLGHGDYMPPVHPRLARHMALRDAEPPSPVVRGVKRLALKDREPFRPNLVRGGPPRTSNVVRALEDARPPAASGSLAARAAALRPKAATHGLRPKAATTRRPHAYPATGSYG